MELCKITAENIDFFAPLMDDEIKSLYYRDGAYSAIGAVWDKCACGILVYRYDGVSISIEHLTVSDSYRRKKVATTLVDALCRTADKNAVPIVCDFFTDGDPDEDERVAFFESMYCFSVERTEDALYSVDRAMMEKSILSDYVGKAKEPSKRIYDLPQKTIRQILKQTGVTEETTGNEADVIKELCLYREDSEDPRAVVFVRKGDSETQLILSYVWKQSKNPPVSEKALLFVLADVFDKALNMEPKVEELRITSITKQSEQLLMRLFPEAKTVGRGISVAWDIGDMPLPYQG